MVYAILAALAVLLLAVPAAAQDADPYGEVLPREIQTDGTASPTAQTPAPVTTAALGTLPRTGQGLTIGLLVLAFALVAMGTGTVIAARRRSPG